MLPEEYKTVASVPELDTGGERQFSFPTWF